MVSDSTLVFALIGIAAVLMASNRVRLDIVALLVVLSLILSGTLTVKQSLSGFGSPVVILVAGLLVIGEMLARTGVAGRVGDWILSKGGRSETRLLFMVMAGSAFLGAVMSSTAVVAIFIPIILRISSETGLNRSRFLLPMSYAALISGMLTLIATTPNIVVHEELKSEGYSGFGFFGFSMIGLTVLVVAIIYMLLLGRRVLPSEPRTEAKAGAGRSIFDIWRHHNESDEFVRVKVNADSRLAGKTVAESGIESRYRVRLIGASNVGSGDGKVVVPNSSTVFTPGDELALVGGHDELARLFEEQSVTSLPKVPGERERWLGELGGAAVLIHPESCLIGQSLRDVSFHEKYHLQVLGLRRGNDRVDDFAEETLQRGDSLFVFGTWPDIKQLAQRNHDFVVLETPREYSDIVPKRRKMPIAVLILAAMVALAVFDVVPLTAAVLLAVLAAVFTGCLNMEDAYRSIHWSSIVLIAGMLPLADALTVTGGTEIIVNGLLDFAGEAGPYKMMTILFFLTAALGLVLSNTASAVLVAPIAIYTAQAMGVSPYPFAVAVLIAASAAYSTPVSTPVVTLVVEPGGYSFSTFVKVGVPLLFLTYAATLLVAPIVFPF